MEQWKKSADNKFLSIAKWFSDQSNEPWYPCQHPTTTKRGGLCLKRINLDWDRASPWYPWVFKVCIELERYLINSVFVLHHTITLKTNLCPESIYVNNLINRMKLLYTYTQFQDSLIQGSYLRTEYNYKKKWRT